MPLDRELYEHVCSVLFENWDPIGVNEFAPRDEYDSYAAGLIRMIHDGADESKVAEHLGRLARESMRLSHVDEGRDRIVAVRLLDLVGKAANFGPP